jgi:hypothetical protein
LTKLLAWSAKLTKLLAWSAKCSSIIQSYHIKALTPGMEFKSELFHPTKIKIDLTSFENFENELFTIFMKKNFNTLELTLGQLDCTVCTETSHLMETATMTSLRWLGKHYSSISDHLQPCRHLPRKIVGTLGTIKVLLPLIPSQ